MDFGKHEVHIINVRTRVINESSLQQELLTVSQLTYMTKMIARRGGVANSTRLTNTNHQPK